MQSGRTALLVLAVAAAAAMTMARPAARAAARQTGPQQASAQQPTVVRGRVEIGIPIATRRTTNTYSRTITAAKLAPVSEVRNVVVYLKDAPKRPLEALRISVKQENESFFPRVVAVPVGSVVDFPNADPIYHNVFSLSRVKIFNLGRYPQGQTRQVRFDKPGLVKVFCEIHSHMSATVMVFDHPWFAVPGDDGRFELPAVPSSDRQITAWHERLGDTTLRVRVEPGRAAAADFILPVPQQP